jgi:hypothetical protein
MGGSWLFFGTEMTKKERWMAEEEERGDET